MPQRPSPPAGTARASSIGTALAAGVTVGFVFLVWANTGDHGFWRPMTALGELLLGPGSSRLAQTLVGASAHLVACTALGAAFVLRMSNRCGCAKAIGAGLLFGGVLGLGAAGVASLAAHHGFGGHRLLIFTCAVMFGLLVAMLTPLMPEKPAPPFRSRMAWFRRQHH